MWPMQRGAQRVRARRGICLRFIWKAIGSQSNRPQPNASKQVCFDVDGKLMEARHARLFHGSGNLVGQMQHVKLPGPSITDVEKESKDYRLEEESRVLYGVCISLLAFSRPYIFHKTSASPPPATFFRLRFSLQTPSRRT